MLTKGAPFDTVEEGNDGSAEGNRCFFHCFNKWFISAYDHVIFLPATVEQINHVENYYRQNCLTGAIGSIACVHVGWDMCPVGLWSQCKGKEGYPTLAFEVVVSHTRKILACSDAYFGTWNDITISKHDPAIQKL